MPNEYSRKYISNTGATVSNISEILRIDALYNGNYDYNEDAADYVSRRIGTKAVRLG